VTNRASFDAISWWFAERSKHAPALAVKMIVGNKTDKVRQIDPPLPHRVINEPFSFSFLSMQSHMRQVSAAEGAAYAAKMGCLFVELSAKTAVGVRETFRDVIEHILNASAL
jgi:Ras-related protein Rab-18